MRKFEIVNLEYQKHAETNKIIPIRSSRHSAGYDFYSPIDVTIAPNSMALIWTDIRAKMEGDEVLMIYPRSSMGKIPLVLANGTGVIDSDYYANSSTGGNIGIRLHNLSEAAYEIKAGDKIAQGVFITYLTTDDDDCDRDRTGGYGSSGK